MKLIDNWRRGWRMFSVQALLLVGGLQGIIAALSPVALAAMVPGTSITWGGLGAALSVLVAVLGAIGRLVDQGAVVTPPAP